MFWLLRNFRDRLRFALENPRYSLRSLYRELTSADERFIASMTGVSVGRVRRFLDEPSRTEFFAECLQEVRASIQALRIGSADLYAKKILVQYAAIRAFQPGIVVETGVANGVSSA